MNFKKRSEDKELLDADDISLRDIISTMHELSVINTYLGGHSITCRGIAHFLQRAPKEQPLAVAEIGCGGGDNLRTISNFLRRLDRPVALTGIDLKPECIKYARRKSIIPISWVASDYRKVTWANDRPDVIFSSLFCHHFTDAELTQQLIWLKDNSKMGFFINDLHRHPLAYYSIKLITRIFSQSRLVRNDAAVSVSRGFRKQEWVKIFADAGIKNYTIKWQWAFRYLICVDNEQ